ncbi:hypothetical protein LJC27_02810 [Christensenellaceae bacterium OttesenSCG-928-M15]|nr:hypothetical protein [Christensenellaceae bacterium OttesenSCG-928-M15]
MPNEKVWGALGLSRRAGKCMTGDFACERAVRANKARLVVVDETLASAVKEKYRRLCAGKDILYLELPRVGEAVGKPAGKIAAITDQGFAGMIKNAASNNE